MNRLITWGAGELGGRVGRLWVQAGGQATGLTRSEQRHDALTAAGIEPRLGSPADLLRPDDALLFALPGHATQREAVETLSGVAPPARAVFISTTGYYGLPQGSINEQTARGQSERAASIAAAEQTFFEWAGEAGVVIRLGGLYSRERGPFAALRRRGYVARSGPSNKTLALIHYDDAATALLAALSHLQPQPLYLAVTPPCPTREEFYTAACARLDLPPPTFDAPLPHPPARFDVSLLRRDLLPSPAYPDWRAILKMVV